MTRLYDVVVKKRHVQGQNVAVLEFESIDATRLPKIEAGSHIDVHLPGGLLDHDPVDLSGQRRRWRW